MVSKVNLDKNFKFLNDLEFENKNSILRDLEEMLENHFNKKYQTSISKGRLIKEAFYDEIKKFHKTNSDWGQLLKNEDFENSEIKNELYKIQKLTNYASHFNNRKLKIMDSLNIIYSFWSIFNYYLGVDDNQDFDPTIYLINDKPTNYKIIDPDHNEMDELNETFKIDRISLLDWFKDNSQIIIPIYQRKYVWSESHVETLVNDIFTRVEDNENHYFGTIAGKIDNKTNNTKRIKLIDGQQRITTSIILFCSIYDYIRENDHDNKDLREILEKNNLKNWTVLDREYIKKTSFKIITDISSNFKEKEKQIIAKDYEQTNCWLNYKKVRELTTLEYGRNMMDFDIFISTFLKKFSLTSISFDNETYDNKREMEIFEGFNSKGTSLDKYDLITNHILNLCDSKIYLNDETIINIRNIYNIHIDQHFEDNKDNKESVAFFDSIIHYWTGKEVKKQDNYYLHQFKDVIDEMFELNGREFKTEDEFKNFCIKIEKYIEIFKYCSTKNLKTNELIDKYELYEIINLISWTKKKPLFIPLIYYLKDIIETTSKSSYNDIREIKLIFFDFAKLIITAFLTKGQGDSRLKRYIYQKINELKKENTPLKYNIFKNKFIVESLSWLDFSNNVFDQLKLRSNLTNDEMLSLLNIILYTMEKGVDNDINLYSNHNIKFTLEHVLPKNAEEWRKEKTNLSDLEFEEFHKNNVNKLGNSLLLTRKINSKVSNSTFKNKKKEYENNETKLYKNLDNLNIDMSSKNEWNEASINARTIALVDYLENHVLNDLFEAK